MVPEHFHVWQDIYHVMLVYCWATASQSNLNHMLTPHGNPASFYHVYGVVHIIMIIDVYIMSNYMLRSMPISITSQHCQPGLTSYLLKKQARHQCDVCTPSSDCLVVYNQFVTLKKCMAATVNKFLRSRQENINN